MKKIDKLQTVHYDRLTKRFVLLAVTTLAFVCAAFIGGVFAWEADRTWGSDYNTETEFYIYDADDLARFASMVNGGRDFSGKRVVLADDIDLQNQEWTPVGSSERYAFKGEFDGSGHTISNMYQTLNTVGNIGGLFGYVSGGTLTQVTLDSATIMINTGSVTAGGVVAVLQNNGNVNNCNVNILFDTKPNTFFGYLGIIVLGYTAGGVVGVNSGGAISSNGDVTANVNENIFRFSFSQINYDTIVASGGYGDVANSVWITATSDENGEISNPNRVMYPRGTDVTYYFTPNPGYELGTVLVDNYDVTSMSRDTNSYTFENVQASHTIDVTYTYNPTYKITIPSSLDIQKDESRMGTLEIVVSEMWVLETGFVIVWVESENAFHLVHTVQNIVDVPYTLRGSSGAILSTGSEVIQFTMSEYMDLTPVKPSTTLTATVTGHPKLLGEYKDVLTFTFSYNEGIA